MVWANWLQLNSQLNSTGVVFGCTGMECYFCTSKQLRSSCGSVDKTTDSQSWGPRFESAGSGSSVLGKFLLNWFSSHKEIQIFVRYVPSIQVLTEGRLTLQNEHEIMHSFCFLMDYGDVSTKLGWKGFITYLTKNSSWLLNQIGCGFLWDADN